MKTLAIIQAHMGSSRLPGKVLMDLAGKTALERVVERTRRCPEIDEVLVATSSLRMDDDIEAACKKMNVPMPATRFPNPTLAVWTPKCLLARHWNVPARKRRRPTSAPMSPFTFMNIPSGLPCEA